MFRKGNQISRNISNIPVTPPIPITELKTLKGGEILYENKFIVLI